MREKGVCQESGASKQTRKEAARKGEEKRTSATHTHADSDFNLSGCCGYNQGTNGQPPPRRLSVCSSETFACCAFVPIAQFKMLPVWPDLQWSVSSGSFWKEPRLIYPAIYRLLSESRCCDLRGTGKDHRAINYRPKRRRNLFFFFSLFK